jgi:ribosome-associated protein
VTATHQAVELAVEAAEAAADKLALDVVAFDVSDALSITDVFVIASATTDRQVKAVIDNVEERIRLARHEKPIRTEGYEQGRWVLLDYGDVVVHVQHEEEREFYSLERLWKDCPVLDLPESVRLAGEQARRLVEDERRPLEPWRD